MSQITICDVCKKPLVEGEDVVLLPRVGDYHQACYLASKDDSSARSSADSAQDVPGLVQDLPLIWQGWCNAIRLMEDKATVRRPENAAQAAAYEQCAKDLKEALTRPALTVPQTAPKLEALESCKGEQLKFEEWAAAEKYDMHEHPLHYLFMDDKTNAARQGWKAALRYAATVIAGAQCQAESAK